MSPIEKQDLNLLQKAKTGNQGAFRELYDKYSGRIFAVCYGKIGNREDAYDLVQETFIKAFRSLDGYRGDAQFYSWVYRIAMNCCMDFLRKKQRRGKRETLSEDVDQSDENKRKGTTLVSLDNPMMNVDAAELGERILEAIHGLTQEHKEMILLREVEGMSYEEIAELLGIQKGTVMSRLFYARKLLQEKLKEWGLKP